jgi:hypothetical protein
MENDLYKVLSWHSKLTTLKYILLAATGFTLNVIYGWTFTMILLAWLGPKLLLRVAWFSIKGETARRQERLMIQQRNLMTEEAFCHILICFYTVLNRLVDLIKSLILIESPLKCFLHMLVLIGLSGVAFSIGDKGAFWTVVFAGFLLPAFVKKNESSIKSGDSETKLVKLSDEGNLVMAVALDLWSKIDARIPKFSDLQSKSQSEPSE